MTKPYTVHYMTAEEEMMIIDYLADVDVENDGYSWWEAWEEVCKKQGWTLMPVGCTCGCAYDDAHEPRCNWFREE